MVVFSDLDCLLNALLLSVLHALLTEAAIHGVLDVDHLALVVEREHFPWALGHEHPSLLFGELVVKLLLVKLDSWFLAHDDGRDWTPLGVNLADAFLGNHFEVNRLVLCQLYDGDWVLLVPQVVSEHDWSQLDLFAEHHVAVDRLDVLRSHFKLVVEAPGLEVELKCALVAHRIAVAVLVELECVNVEGVERNEAKSVSDHLVMKRSGVFSDLNKVDSHGWNLTNYDPSQSISNSKVGVEQLKLNKVSG